MAERRMFSKVITDSDDFLDLPSSSQTLYFHLAMHADDDGFTSNPKTVMRMIGARDDDLKILIAKNFILTFDSSSVIVIRDWRLQNAIRKDRKKPTLYQNELKTLEDKNGSYTHVKNTDIAGGATTGQPDDNQVTTKRQHRLGKVRLGKVSIEKKRAKNRTNHKSKIYDENSDYMKLAKFMFKEIRKNDPKYKEPNWNRWADDFRKLVELDNRNKSEVCQVIKNIYQDEFWKKNILSPSKLRSKYPRFAMEVNDSQHRSHYTGTIINQPDDNPDIPH